MDSVRVRLRPREFIPAQLQPAAARFDPNTRAFTFPAVPETICDVIVTGLVSGVYVADIRQAGQSVFVTGVDARNGVSDHIEINLRSDTANVRGTVRFTGNERPVVLLVPEKQKQVPQLYKRADVNLNTGQFFLSAAPGDYFLYVFPVAPPPTAEENEDFMKKYEGQGRPITLTVSQTEYLELTTINAPGLLPTLADSEFRPQISNRVIRSQDMTITNSR
jgi:hypothetical protein